MDKRYICLYIDMDTEALRKDIIHIHIDTSSRYLQKSFDCQFDGLLLGLDHVIIVVLLQVLTDSLGILTYGIGLKQQQEVEYSNRKLNTAAGS